jgi:hypothetical protein
MRRVNAVVGDGRAVECRQGTTTAGGRVVHYPSRNFIVGWGSRVDRRLINHSASFVRGQKSGELETAQPSMGWVAFVLDGDTALNDIDSDCMRVSEARTEPIGEWPRVVAPE